MIKHLILAFLILSGIACGVKNQKNKDNAKAALPPMSLLNTAGEQVELSSFKGKKVFVNLWATWCPPCVAEMPSIQALYDKANNENAEFILISFDKKFETAQRWVLQKNISVPIYTAASELPEIFQVNGIPTTFIFDENGELIFRHVGSEDYSSSKFLNMLSKN
jgi:thiol-disulfide isomerase/thioredoxin